ncbi:MAG: hypothetical protein ABGW91_00640 [Christiangramia sp.]|nr:hypothetical protein [Christiangramia sp.]
MISSLLRGTASAWVWACLTFALFSCKNESKKNLETSASDSLAKQELPQQKAAENFKIVTNSMEFILPKDTLLSGWNPIVYQNNSNETHFIVFEKYPEGKRLEDTEKEVGPAFQEGMDYIMEGNMDKAMEAFGKLPEWFSQVQFYGGTGLVSPKSTTQSTLKLDPGIYAIECYVKMPNGRFHSVEGMVDEIIVKDSLSDIPEPQADYQISIGSENGMLLEGNPSAGKKVFKVHFEDQKVHENFVGHDVQLVRKEKEANLDTLANWLNWSTPQGLMTPAPKGFKFIAGMQEMAAGKNGYFTAELTPGDYVLISEVPNQREKGLLKEFHVE